MQLEVKVDSERLTKALRVASAEVRHQLGLGLSTSLREIQRSAKTDHRFITKSGQLERSIQFDVDADRLGGDVGIRDSVAPYGRYVHQGTKPHIIEPKVKKSLYWVSGGGKNFAKKVNHPGTSPDRFIYNAADKKRPAIKRIMEETLNKAFKIAGV